MSILDSPPNKNENGNRRGEQRETTLRTRNSMSGQPNNKERLY